MLASRSRAQRMEDEGDAGNVVALVDYFCLTSMGRVEELFRALGHNADRKGYKLAQRVLAGEMGCVEDGIV